MNRNITLDAIWPYYSAAICFEPMQTKEWAFVNGIVVGLWMGVIIYFDPLKFLFNYLK